MKKNYTTVILFFVISFMFFTLEAKNSSFIPKFEKEIASKDVLIEKTKSIHENQLISYQETAITPSEEASSVTLNLQEIFFASPIIYSVLLFMSVCSLIIWLFTLLTFRKNDAIPRKVVKQLHYLLVNQKYEEAKKFCNSKNHLITKIAKAGIFTKDNNHQFVIDSMKSEGIRATAKFWQRISLLKDVFHIAPMLGLLGTVLGMFYAFYDINRSAESLSALFDGLGIAVGTTVAGLIVAIVSMIFYTTLKYRIIKTLNLVENEAISLSYLIKNSPENS